MEELEYKEFKELLEKAKKLKAYDYENAFLFAGDFFRLGNLSAVPNATEDYDKIRVYFEQSRKYKDERLKSKAWKEGYTILVENIELTLGRIY